MVLPGTLLGLFPGMIFSAGDQKPETPKLGCKSYLERQDGWWVNYDYELPYPLPPLGMSFTDYLTIMNTEREIRGLGVTNLL